MSGQNPSAYTLAPTFKILCKINEGYCLTVREGLLVLALANPQDENQHWYKVMDYGTDVKDAEDKQAFALVNKATGLAIKHSDGGSHPVKLVPFNPDGRQDQSVLWTEGCDDGEGFRSIRKVNNISLNLEALKGDDGTEIVLCNCKDGDNQKWMMLPWGDLAVHTRRGFGNTLTNVAVNGPAVRIYCKADEGFSVTVRNGAVCLARSDPDDEFQYWIQDLGHGNNDFKDIEGLPAFALVSRSTGEAIRHSHGEGHQLHVEKYYPEQHDRSFLWTMTVDLGQGFGAIRMANNTSLNFDAYKEVVRDGTEIVLWSWTGGRDNQLWQLVPL